MSHSEDRIPISEASSAAENQPQVRSLKELLDRVSGKSLALPRVEADAGLAENLPFPFLAIVGQPEMKLALTLALINPALGGVLLVGPRGTGKTTAVRSLVDLLPQTMRSLCYYGCMPEDVEAGGIDAVCPNCARKYAESQPLAALDQVRLVELPLNAGLEDVVGGIDERASTHGRLRLKRGLLSQADRNLIYADEVNLLPDEIIDAMLDAASQGVYTVRRGPLAATFRSRFVLIGSMNPEEGRLRPQIMDRFGLRVVVHGLEESGQRLEAYRRVQAYLSNPRQVCAAYAVETEQARLEIQSARSLLPQVVLSGEAERMGLELVHQLNIDSLRAEITLFEAARAYAAADGRTTVEPTDLPGIAPSALRLRRSSFIADYFASQRVEEDEILRLLGEIRKA